MPIPGFEDLPSVLPDQKPGEGCWHASLSRQALVTFRQADGEYETRHCFVGRHGDNHLVVRVCSGEYNDYDAEGKPICENWPPGGEVESLTEITEI